MSTTGGDAPDPSGPWWETRRCPDPETFAAFLDLRLPFRERERVIEHIDACPICHQSFKQIVLALERINLDADEPAARPAPRPRPRPLAPAPPADRPSPAAVRHGVEPHPATSEQVAPQQPAVTPVAARRIGIQRALLAAAVALAVGTGFLLGWKLPERDPRALLASIVPRERPFTPRFTGGIAWSPAAAPRHMRYDMDLNLPPGAVSYLAAAELRGPAPEAPNSRELGAIGASQVLGGRIDPGVETLTRAVAAEPESPELLSDLGAALLSRAEGSDDLEVDGDSLPVREQHDADIPAALEAIDRALEKSPRLPEALFNRALALERLYLRASARKAWQDYLKVDAKSPWAAEARGRLAAIVVPTIADAALLRAEIAEAAESGDRGRLAEMVLNQRHLARRTLQEDLLPAWGDAWIIGNFSDANRKLAAARAIAEEWEAQTTDRTLLSAVDEVSQADWQRSERLARGYDSLGAASRAYAAFDIERTRVTAERAVRELPISSTAHSWAGTFRLICTAYEAGDVESEAKHVLAGARGDTTARGRTLWIIGLARAKRGDHAQALASYREALASYARVEEREPAVWLRSLIGEAYGYMGASGLGWQHRTSAARGAGVFSEHGQVSYIYLASAMLALAERRPRVAGHFLDEALAVPGQMEPYEAVQAFLWRSRIRLALGDRAGATGDLVRASTWFPKVGAMDAAWLRPDLQALRGVLASDPQVAIAGLTEAIEGFRASAQLFRMPGALLARAEAKQRAGDLASADEDLRQASVLHEEQQGGTYPQMLWTAPLDEPDRLFDERVRIALRDGRAAEAFAVAESTRARILRTTRRPGLASGPAAALRLADVESHLGPDVTMLFFAVLSDRVVQWRIRANDSSVVTLSISPRELSRAAAAFKADLEAGAWTAATRELAMRLHAALIRPAGLRQGAVVVVADGPLHGLPFAALVDSTTGRFLVEDRVILVAPSATAYIASRDRQRAHGEAAPADAFVVGDPRVSARLFPGIRPLAGARGEARAIAALYPRRELMVGGAATRAAVVGALGRHQVVHFAGHAVINRPNPDRSSLPLADDADDEGSVLFGSDIAAMDLTHVRVVVLSGCETAGGAVVDGEGPLSLARAFLGAGAPSVVASLWPISDQAPGPLLTAFHRRLRNGERPAAALRSAQLEELYDDASKLRSPSAWASFQAFGG